MFDITEILRVEAGSRANGTSISDDSDKDEISIVVEPLKTVMGLNRQGFKTLMVRTQPDGVPSGPGDLDLNVYSLRTFLELAAAGNPSILAALWAPIINSNDDGDLLRSSSKLFIGRHVIPKHRGYMRQQVLRLFGLRGNPREEYVGGHGYDVKLAMHATRLGMQCIELLTTGGLELPLSEDRALRLREIRKGNVPFDDWWDECQSLDSKLEAMLSDESIRENADTTWIVKLSIRIHSKYWIF